VPKDFIWATVEHRRWPDSKNDVIWVEGSVIQQSLMLSHSVVKWDVIILHPSSERVKKEERVLEPLFDQLLPGVFKQQAVTVMKWVSDLESVNGIGASLFGDLFNLSRQKSVFVQAIIVFDPLAESHFLS